MKAISFKLDENDLEKLEEMVKESRKNRSEFIRNKIFNSDTSDTSGDTDFYKELLIFLNDFFKDNVDYLMKKKSITDFIIENKSKFNEIEELFE